MGEVRFVPHGYISEKQNPFCLSLMSMMEGLSGGKRRQRDPRVLVLLKGRLNVFEVFDLMSIDEFIKDYNIC